MCIVLATTAHPSYALIVLDNRDEFLSGFFRGSSQPRRYHRTSTPCSLYGMIRIVQNRLSIIRQYCEISSPGYAEPCALFFSLQISCGENGL